MPNLKIGNVVELLGALVRGGLDIVVSGANDARATFDAPVGRQAGFNFLSDGELRWQFQRSADAETGSPTNTGSNLDVVRFDDNGDYLSVAMRFYRSNGLVEFPGGINLGTVPGSTADNIQVPSAAWVRDRALWHQEIHPRENATRTTGLMDTPMGVTVPVAGTLNRVYARFTTADGSGSTVITIKKNGSATGMPTITITSGNTTGVWASTPVTVAQNDVLTADITTLGGTPGTGLAVLYSGRSLV